jgi:hypothetical protein
MYNCYLNGCHQKKNMTMSDEGREGDETDDKAINMETDQVMFEGCKVNIISHL